jgi:hypothetical protein
MQLAGVIIAVRFGLERTSYSVYTLKNVEHSLLIDI